MIDFDYDLIELEEFFMDLILQRKIEEGMIVFSGTMSELLN